MAQHQQQHAPAQQPSDHGFKAMMDKVVEMIKDKFNGIAKMFQSAMGDLKGHHGQGQDVPEERLSHLHSPPSHVMDAQLAQTKAIASSQGAGTRA